MAYRDSYTGSYRAELVLRNTQCIASLHELMSEWTDDEDVWHLMRFVLHEWTANLLQHATFGKRTPRLSLHVWQANEHIEAVVEDNSTGFDLNAVPDAALDTLPDRGMGITLMRSCVDHLEYSRDADVNHLYLAISSSSNGEPQETSPAALQAVAATVDEWTNGREGERKGKE